MDHIRLFDTVEEFNSAYTGDGYVEPWVSYCVENSGVSFNKKENPLEKPLTFNIISGGSIYWKEYINDEEAQEVDEYFKEIEYNKNNAGWVTITNNTELSVVAGDTVRFRGNNNSYSYYDENEDVAYLTNFRNSTAVFSVEGNIMSLIDSTNFSSITAMTTDNNGAFSSMFAMCTGLTSAENLILPATTLAEDCYYNMFADCTSLTTAAALPATTLTESCYSHMFYGCTSLTTVPSLPATTLAGWCYSTMFAGCTSLTTAPELPATTLAEGCYYEMFYGCSSLNYIKCLATSIPNTVFLQDWVYGVSATGTFVKSASMSSWTTGNRGIPNGWTVQDAS